MGCEGQSHNTVPTKGEQLTSSAYQPDALPLGQIGMEVYLPASLTLPPGQTGIQVYLPASVTLPLSQTGIQVYLPAGRLITGPNWHSGLLTRLAPYHWAKLACMFIYQPDTLPLSQIGINVYSPT